MSTSDASFHPQGTDACGVTLHDGGSTRNFLEERGVRILPGELASRWWAAVLEHSVAPGATTREGPDGAIVVDVSPGRLAEGRSVLAWAVESARELRVLAPDFTPATVAEQILATAAQLGLTVVPNAKLPTMFHGGRTVTARVIGDRHLYLHALQAAEAPLRVFDEAQSLFTCSAVPPRFTGVVRPDDVVLEEWQQLTLEANGYVLGRADLAAFLGEFAQER